LPSEGVRIMRTHLIRALPAAALLTVSLAAPAVAAVIDGTNGPDVLTGTASPDTIRGYKGTDTLYGKGGADRLYGGRDTRRDLLYGGGGRDHIYARGLDWVYAGGGNDTIRVTHLDPYAGQGGRHTRVYCGPGDDTVITSAPNWFWTFSCEHVIKLH
jgi:Ca2+-binding RTX toxin-like protein